MNDKDDFAGAHFNSDLVTDVPEVQGNMIAHPFYNELEQFVNGMQVPWTYVPKGMGIYGS